MFARRDRKRPRKSNEGTRVGGGVGGGRDGSGGGGGGGDVTTISRIISSLSRSASSSNPSSSRPLRGVIACLSGYTATEKDELHALIEGLGGQYTRDFSLDENTHLITEAPQGAKYDLASSSSSSSSSSAARASASVDHRDSGGGGGGGEGIHIVTRSWLEACASSKSGVKVSESDHKLLVDDRPQLSSVITTLPGLLSVLDEELLTSSGGDWNRPGRSGLLDSFQLYLLGFQADQNRVHPPERLHELKNKLSVLVRRAGGTIFWELNEDVNLVVLCDGCDDILHKAAEVLSTHHPQAPPSVSPLWILNSWKYNQLQPVGKYLPRPAPAVPLPTQKQQQQQQDQHNNNVSELSKQPPSAPTVSVRRNSTSSTTSMMAVSRSAVSTSTSTQLTVFRGCLFSLLRVPPQYGDDDVLDFDPNEQETFIKSRGGQILSSELLGAIRADTKKQQQQQQQRSNSSHGANSGGNKSTSTTTTKRRRCYVVCWGDADGPPRLEMNQLLAQAQREGLCDMVLVTPVWLQTCVDVRKCVRPDRLPLVLEPQHWPLRSLIVPRNRNRTSSSSKKRKNNHNSEGESTGNVIAQRKGNGKGKGNTTTPTSNGPNPVVTVHVSLTGFQGTEKIALIHLIGAMGGTYHDNMSQTNTHLICKENATGLKREKAIEWNIHVVKIEWLYHILRYGLAGEHDESTGCESRFSVLEDVS